MKIIKGQKLESIIETCGFRLDEFYKQLEPEKYSQSPGRFMLELEFSAPENLTGIGITSNEKLQTWVLEREVTKKNLLGRNIKYLEFEIISEDDVDENIYIPTEELIPLLLHLSEEHDSFDIQFLHDTIGLEDNVDIQKYFNNVSALRKKEKGLDKIKPREYYDKEFGSKADSEKILNKKAKLAINTYGTGQGSGIALNHYSEIIEINPLNSYAYFNRGLAVWDFWEWEKANYMFDSRPIETKKEEIRTKEIEIGNRSEADFRRAINLHPYFAEDYEILRKKGRIK